ncbi:MAG: pyrroline-5-carboxylate reductase [Verrucomicrobia bacterium]|nr:pyrroline-5-carboxylate reductase [Verrucomicrobiota bacterium]MBU1735841.1 pyrroline-5-carboxylate reductase [Verrucomicrobiota bacterium]MBU1857259.1 pyrroline-5-carboxylate reductase [Verrucomicrobiota bacterium]
MNAPISQEWIMTFVGAGNMAEALVHGIIRAKLLSSPCLRVTDTNRRRLDHFQATFGVTGFERNADGIRGAQVVVLAVKPQVMAGVLKEIGAQLAPGTLVVSIAAGVSTHRMQQQLPAGMRVVRVMPNMPALTGAGVSVYCLGKRASEDDARLVESLFQSVGVVVRLDEKHLDAVTALSGSGPAYVFFLAEFMMQAGYEMGLDHATAKTLTLGTIRGAARLLEEMGQEPEELRQRVTSKGGTTAAAMDVLETGRVKEIFIKAIRAAQKRSRELSEEMVNVPRNAG